MQDSGGSVLLLAVIVLLALVGYALFALFHALLIGLSAVL